MNKKIKGVMGKKPGVPSGAGKLMSMLGGMAPKKPTAKSKMIKKSDTKKSMY